MGMIRLTPEGVRLLEEEVAEAFAENPDEIRRAAEAVGLDLDNLLSNYIKEAVGREEERMYGRRYKFS